MKRIDYIPWAGRVDMRHTFQQMHSECLETRASLARGDLNLTGLLEDIRHMHANLSHILSVVERYERMAPDTPKPPPECRIHGNKCPGHETQTG